MHLDSDFCNVRTILPVTCLEDTSSFHDILRSTLLAKLLTLFDLHLLHIMPGFGGHNLTLESFVQRNVLHLHLKDPRR